MMIAMGRGSTKTVSKGRKQTDRTAVQEATSAVYAAEVKIALEAMRDAQRAKTLHVHQLLERGAYQRFTD